MESHLNLIKTELLNIEKRILPRFPYHYLTFKGVQDWGGVESKAFAVKDISLTGMQLSLKNGGHDFLPAKEIAGELHWCGSKIDVLGQVQWVNGGRLGVAFAETDKELKASLCEFLSPQNIVAKLKALHLEGPEIDLPTNLKYWWRADGPCEIFIWSHRDGEHSCFQIILMERFIEWVDGKGLKSGRVLTKRDLESPLASSDEFVFQLEDCLSAKELGRGVDLIHCMGANLIDKKTKEFLLTKLGSGMP